MVEGEEAISNLVEWAENIIRARGEERKAWFEGKAWLFTMDLWVTLGRKVSIHGSCSAPLADTSR
jgi:hypothetical protein